MAVVTCFVLTQCASVGGAGDGREGALKALGYDGIALQKLPGDNRYSGVFEVNGQPMRFLIDSGANSTDLEKDFAEAANLIPDRSVKVISRGALGRKIEGSRGIGSLRIGSMMSRSFPFTIAPKSKKRTSTSSYAGQIGLDALSGTGSLVDIPSGMIWVPGERAKITRVGGKTVLGPRRDLGVRLLRLSPAGSLPHLILSGRMQGRPVTWVVDTGAEVSVMAAESFDQFGLSSVATNSRMIDASGDRIPLRRARLSNVDFGEVRVEVFDVAVAPLATVRKYFRDLSGRPVDGIIGMDFLMDGAALLDSGSGILYLGKE